MTITLPTEKTPPTLTAEQSKILLYGQAGIGKTTAAVNLDPEHTLLLASEPGYGGIEAFVQPIASWEDFRAVGAALAGGDHKFKLVVVDTTDELFRFCQDYVMAQHGIKHPSDLEYGKGWSMLSDEFRLRVGKLASLGIGVVFISHAQDVEVEQRIGKLTKTVPTLRGQAGKFLLGFVDFIFFATQNSEGQRIVRTQPAAGMTFT